MSSIRSIAIAAALAGAAAPACGQAPTGDPFPEPIEATADVVRVNFVEFATIPDIDGTAARLMTLVDEPGTRRLFVSDMRGPIYRMGHDGGDVAVYVDVNDARWGVGVESASRERGVQSFAFHPQFAEQGAPGYGKFYTWMDTPDTTPEPDLVPGGGNDTHDTVLLEWTARDPAAAAYDGEAPRELMRFEQPFPNHNAGHLAFNPLARPGDADYGLLYVGVADGGSGGDPLNLSQNLASGFGKIFRIDPLGRDSRNGQYGIPADNPFVSDGRDDTLGEIWAYGVRNPQRFAWDPANGTLFLADIGQNTVEEVSVVTRGANLGWNVWEGSYRYLGREGVGAADPRGDAAMTFPVVEWDQIDPLLMASGAASGVHVYRAEEIPQLRGLLLFTDMPSGEIFYVRADDLPDGGQDAIRRVLFEDGGEAKTLLQLIRETNAARGAEPAPRADARLGAAADGRVFVLNKYDGIIRLLVP